MIKKKKRSEKAGAFVLHKMLADEINFKSDTQITISCGADNGNRVSLYKEKYTPSGKTYKKEQNRRMKIDAFQKK